MKKAVFLCLSLFITQYVEGFVITEKLRQYAEQHGDDSTKVIKSEEIACTKKNEKRLRHMLYKSYTRDNVFYKKKCSSFHVLEVKDSLCSYELFGNLDFFI